MRDTAYFFVKTRVAFPGKVKWFTDLGHRDRW